MTGTTSDRYRTLRAMTTPVVEWPGWTRLILSDYSSGAHWYDGILPVEEVPNEVAVVAARHARVQAEKAVHDA